MKFFCFKKIGGVATSCLLVVAILTLSFGPIFSTKKAEAIPVTVVADPGWVAGTKTSVETTLTTAFSKISAGIDYLIKEKEFILDKIAWQLINIVLKTMITQTTNWIKSGFKGSPAFLQDLDGFLVGVGDKVAGEMLADTSPMIKFMCAPFKLQVQAALKIQYNASKGYKSDCSLSDITNNVNAFFKSGNPMQGGWDNWYKVTSQPEANPYGQLLLAQQEFSGTISNTRGQQIKLFDFSKGFLNVEQCTKIDSRTHCRTVTPGTAIQEQLNTSLAGGQTRLQIADELNELASAFFETLVTEAFKGLASYGTPYDSSYVDTGVALGSIGGAANPAADPAQNPIKDSITSETAYLNVQKQIQTALLGAAAYKDSIYGAADNCHSGNLTNKLQTALVDANSEIAISTNNLNTLNILFVQYAAASAQPDSLASANALQSIMTQYLTLFSSGTLANAGMTKMVVDFDLPDILTQIAQFKSDVDNQCLVVWGGGGNGP